MTLAKECSGQCQIQDHEKTGTAGKGGCVHCSMERQLLVNTALGADHLKERERRRLSFLVADRAECGRQTKIVSVSLHFFTGCNNILTITSKALSSVRKSGNGHGRPKTITSGGLAKPSKQHRCPLNNAGSFTSPRIQSLTRGAEATTIELDTPHHIICKQLLSLNAHSKSKQLIAKHSSIMLATLPA